ncbi:MAG TPA: CPBP family intramembrane glutamic endopeptidase [Bryobacteraceae bacterium]|nr:CPBP family intramembrane glutamic endopeptidase [Bryobacteraceae bacterium]
MWIALFIAARVYSNEYPHLHWITTAAFPAFVVEVTFYLATMFESTRNAFARIASRRTQAALIWISGLLPYLVFSLAAGTFARNAFYLLAILTVIFSFWYAILPRRFAYDVGFLVVAAAPILLHVFPRIYISPDAHLRIDVLGHLMWIRAGVLALLVLREWDAGAFSLWPDMAEWRSGFTWFAVFVLPIAALALVLHDVRFDPLAGPWWRTLGIAVGTFLGVLWVVALAEELFFRGVIERAFLNTWRQPVAAILLSALIFGAVHLWFHEFPNWRRACVAGLLGVGCGIAYWRSGSVRAPMVTHAFVVTTWRVFFK